jgi:hypothetical protein
MNEEFYLVFMSLIFYACYKIAIWLGDNVKND